MFLNHQKSDLKAILIIIEISASDCLKARKLKESAAFKDEEECLVLLHASTKNKVRVLLLYYQASPFHFYKNK